MSDARITLSAVDKTAAGINSAKARLGSLAGEAEALSTRFSGVAGAIAGALTVGGLANFFNTIVGGLDRLNDLSDATGASIENLSALEDIAARTGTQMGTVGDAVIKLNKALGDAKPNSDQARAFKALGLSAEELKRIDPAEALRQVAVALSGYADDGNKARVVQELFGKSLKEVAPLLNDLAKSGELIAKVTKEQTDEAEEFNQELAKLQKNVTDASRSLVSDLLPALNQLIAGLRQGGVRGFGDAVGELNGLGKEYYAQRNLVTLAEDLRLLQLQLETAPKGPGKTQLKRELDEKIKAYEDARNLYIKVRGLDKPAPEFRASQNYGDTRASLPNPGQPPRGVREQVSPFDQYIDRLREALRGTQDLTEAEKVRVAIAEGRLGDLKDAQRAYALELAAVLDLTKQPAAFVGPEIAEDLLRERKAQLQELKSLADGSTAAQYEKLAATAQAAADAFRQGTLSAQDFNRVAEELGKRFEGLQPALEKVSGFAEQAGRNIQDALGESVLATIEGNAGSIEKVWRTMLLRLAAQAIAADLGKLLLGNFGGTGQIGGLLGSLGNFIFGGARAGGGPVSPGRAYLVGERGPEIVVPRAAGTVVPNHAMGGTSVTVNVAAGVTRGEVTAAVQLGMQTAEANMMQRLRAARVL